MSDPAGYLLDTNVVSELAKRRPNAAVFSFLERIEQRRTYVSVLTLGELRRGVVRRGERETELSRWVDRIELRFARRTLPIDKEVARVWGELSAGRSRPVVDTLLAATAMVHGLVLVTRNTRDVADAGVDLLNPWQS